MSKKKTKRRPKALVYPPERIQHAMDRLAKELHGLRRRMTRSEIGMHRGQAEGHIFIDAHGRREIASLNEFLEEKGLIGVDYKEDAIQDAVTEAHTRWDRLVNNMR